MSMYTSLDPDLLRAPTPARACQRLLPAECDQYANSYDHRSHHKSDEVHGSSARHREFRQRAADRRDPQEGFEQGKHLAHVSRHWRLIIHVHSPSGDESLQTIAFPTKDIQTGRKVAARSPATESAAATGSARIIRTHADSATANMPLIRIIGSVALLLSTSVMATESVEVANSRYDAQLAQSLGADELGMRSYVLVILKTGPTKVPTGSERDEMFKGHFANMKRLSAEGKLALAGPLDGVDGWRGLFVFAVADIEQAKELVATDPVIIQGEMIAEYHKYFGSAALMQVRDTHDKIAKKKF